MPQSRSAHGAYTRTSFAKDKILHRVLRAKLTREKGRCTDCVNNFYTVNKSPPYIQLNRSFI